MAVRSATRATASATVDMVVSEAIVLADDSAEDRCLLDEYSTRMYLVASKI